MAALSSFGTSTVSQSALDRLTNLETEANQDDATAKGQGIVAQGDAAEAGQYGLAANTALEQARLERVAGGIKDFQEETKLYKTVSGQAADVAGAGFANSGTSLYMMRDSQQQGALTRQINEANTSIAAGGYEEQASAAYAEQTAAMAASGAAQSLAESATIAGTTARTNALNYATSLTPGGAPYVPAGIAGDSLAGQVQSILGIGNAAPTGAGSAGGGGGGGPGAATDTLGNDERSVIMGANFDPWVGAGKSGTYLNPAKVGISGSLDAGTNTILSKR